MQDRPDDITPDICKEKSPRKSLQSGYCDTYREVDDSTWSRNWARTFGKRTQKRNDRTQKENS